MVKVINHQLLTEADVNLKNNGGRTALHYAASKGWMKIAGLLIAHGAKINVKDKVYNLNSILFLVSHYFHSPFSTFTFYCC